MNVSSIRCCAQVSNNMYTLQTCLTNMMGRPITMDQLQQDVGLMVEKITYVTLMFRRVRLRMEEYVCLKVITMLSQGKYIQIFIVENKHRISTVSSIPDIKDKKRDLFFFFFANAIGETIYVDIIDCSNYSIDHRSVENNK